MSEGPDATHERMRALIQADASLNEELRAGPLLRRIVDAARQLLGTDYAALGVLSQDDKEFSLFVHTGVDSETARRIGRLPQGKGLLGVALTDQVPFRCREIAADPRSVGFPTDHPPMAGFMGVPLRVGDADYGCMYVADEAPRSFLDSELELFQAFAETAGMALRAAKIAAHSARRRVWLEAATDATREVLDLLRPSPRRLLLETLRSLAAADRIALVENRTGRVEITASFGVGTTSEPLSRDTAHELYELIGTHQQAIHSRGDGAVMSDGGLVVGELFQAESSPILAAPIVTPNDPHGVVILARDQGRVAFDDLDLEMTATFIRQTSLALELRELRTRLHKADLLEEQARISRDLHDHVIQQLFGASVLLQSLDATPEPGSEQVQKIVDLIRDAIGEVRTIIYQLRPRAQGPGDLRTVVMEVTEELTPLFESRPRVRLEGPLEIVSDRALVLDVRAVLREALTNVARHAQATAVQVRAHADAAAFTLTVTDDGRGFPGDVRRSGLENLARRARLRGGSLAVNSADPPPGTALTWSVPLD